MSEEKEIATVTPERRSRGKIVEVSRGAVAGGNVAGMGQHDAWAFYPDFLIEQRLLGDESDAQRRRNAAFSFAEIWAKTHKSEKSNIRDSSRGGQPGERHTSDSDIDSNAAWNEMEWLLLQKFLGAHRREVEWICLELQAPTYPINLDGVKALKASDDPALLRRAAEMIERRQQQQRVINAHIALFLGRGGAVIDALDALERALERASEQARRN